jgi:hypothetical protein
MAKYQRRSEQPIEAVSVEAILDAETEEEVPAWVHDAQARGRLRIQRNLIEIIGGNFAATATRRDMLCFDETKPERDQIFYLSSIQFRSYAPVNE